MIEVERYCQCGERLVTKVADEKKARKLLEDFLHKHIGREDDGTIHARMPRWQYWKMIRKANAEMKQSAEAAAKKILEEGRFAPNTRRYKLR